MNTSPFNLCSQKKAKLLKHEKNNKKKHLEEDAYREYSSQSCKKLRTGSCVRRVQQSLLYWVQFYKIKTRKNVSEYEFSAGFY